MCVCTKKPYSTLAEYGHTLYSKFSTLLNAMPVGIRYIVGLRHLDTPNEENQQENLLTINPYTCRLTILNTEAGLLTYSAWSAFPIFSVAI
jgi:hypothetical protein